MFCEILENVCPAVIKHFLILKSNKICLEKNHVCSFTDLVEGLVRPVFVRNGLSDLDPHLWSPDFDSSETTWPRPLYSAENESPSVVKG